MRQQLDLTNVTSSSSCESPVIDAVLALGRNSVDTIIAQFSDSASNPFLTTWINFSQKNLRAAEKCCWDMRKQGASSAVASYFLSKVLYNLSAGQRIKVFAWCAVSAVKALKEEAFRTKVSYKDIITSILKELDGLAIEVKTDVDRILVEQINHYKIIYLASEEHLSAAFEEQRAKYLEDPNDIDNLRKLGWTLHDCINQSLLRNDPLLSQSPVHGFFPDKHRIQERSVYIKNRILHHAFTISSVRFFSSLVAASISFFAKIALTTATPHIPFPASSATFSSVIPPIATTGICTA